MGFDFRGDARRRGSRHATDKLLIDGTITVVPEPAATLGLTLLLSGGLLRRRRR